MMRAQPTTLLFAGISIFVAIAAGLCASIGELGVSLALAGIACVSALMLGLRLVGGFNNLLFVFLGFHLLYGLSGPVNALYGEPLNKLFTQPYETASFLASFAYATAGLSAALLVCGLITPLRRTSTEMIAVDTRLLGRLSLLFALLATFLELTNLIRVGPSAAFEGKAVYQSAVDALTLTAPSYEVARIAFCLLGLAIAGRRRMKAADPTYQVESYGVWFLIILLPLMILTLLLGRRGPILDWIFLYFVASTWYESRRRLGRAVATGILITYLTMGMLFANRATLAYSFLVNDFSMLVDHALMPEVIVSGLNPGGNEFGAAFGNFSEYNKYDVEGPQFGRTYLQGFALVVPSFLYPATKPQPVAYAFRDRFFPGVAEEGAISSTAYSSLLEAYVNFRNAGVVLVYALIGVCLYWLEALRRNSRSLVSAMIYLAVLPSAVVFHRSDFGASVISPVFFSLMLIVGAMVLLYALRALGNRDPRLAGPPSPSAALDG